MRWAVSIAVIAALVSPAARAEEMARSLRPQANPALMLPDPAVLPDQAAAASGGDTAQPLAVAPSDSGLASSLRPMPRPEGLDRKVAAARAPEGQGLDLPTVSEVTTEPPPETGKKKKKKGKETAAGSVCGVKAIKGEPIAPIKSKVKGCGLKEGVRVTSVSGVTLSPAPTIDCATASALNTWVRDVLQPVYGGDVVELRIAAHYICRTRNNIKGAKISEHGRGKAVDIGAIVLASGKALTVAGNYNKAMRKAHKGACGIFSTTLGPGSDGYHEDHLHFDTAGYRSGPYCR